MKTLILFCLGLSCSTLVLGQTTPTLRMQKQLEAALPEVLTKVHMEWVAIDDDTLMDLVVTGTASDGFLHLLSFRNKITSLEWQRTQITSLLDGYLQLADMDRDNRIDLLISGHGQSNTAGLFLFRSLGDFSFSQTKLLDHVGLFRVADFNNDGRSDLLTYDSVDNSSLTIHKRDSIGYSSLYDSAQIKIKDVVIADFNNDGTLDFVVSGKDKQEISFVTSFIASGGRFKTRKLSNPILGLLTAIDFNHDGWVDLIETGKGSSGYVDQLWLGGSSGAFVLSSTKTSVYSSYLFTGDMNSDGDADVVTVPLGTPNRIQLNLGSEIKTLMATGLADQQPGDFDRDGDLDIGYLKDSISQQWLSIVALEATHKNNKPTHPGSPFAISTDNKTFVMWDPGTDDHTPPASLTYDVWVGSPKTILAGNFQIKSGSRMIVTQGNGGNTQAKVINNLKDGRYEIYIQTVDNAYQGSPYGKCSGILCFDLVHEDINVCQGQSVVLTATGTAYWFSSQSGFIQKSPSFSFVASKNDTLYSFVPQGSDCSKNRIYRIHVYDADSESNLKYACEGAAIKLNVEPGWQSVQWDTNPPVTNSNTVQIIMDGVNKDITATATSGPGCTHQKVFHLKLSIPKLGLSGTVFRIRKGSSVQLDASGVFSTFFWSPGTGLSNVNIGNPVAEPDETTTYRITAADSIGCTATAEVQVLVEFTAFVPNLFTPNADNKNDAFLIYGLGSTSGFHFQVFNREGSLVFETADPVAASSTGWNGYVNGTRQPPGVYYWKVEGSTDSGDPLLLNGKKSGSVLLLH